MNVLNPLQTSHFARVLARREHELCLVLNGTEVTEGTGADHDVIDFKDMAAEENAALIDEAKAEQAAHELEQVLAARHRLHGGTYGLCVDCGEPIPTQRLESLPATPYCVDCQAVHEHSRSARH